MRALYFLMWAIAVLRSIQGPEIFLPWQPGAAQRWKNELKENALVFLIAGLCAWDIKILNAETAFYLKAAGLVVFYGFGYARGRSEVIFSLFFAMALELVALSSDPAAAVLEFIFILAGITLFQFAFQGVRFRLFLSSPPKRLAGLPAMFIALWILIFIFYVPVQQLSALLF